MKHYQGADKNLPSGRRAIPTLLEARSHLSPPRETKLSSFDSRTVPVRDQFDCWRSEVAASFGTVERDGPYDAPFHATLDNYLTTRVGYARHHVAHAASIERDKKAIAHGNFDCIGIQYRLRGHEQENSLDHGTLFAPGKLRLHDASQPFFSRNTGYENIAVVFNRRHLADRLPVPCGQLNGLTLPEGTMTMLLRDHMVSAFNALAHASRAEAEKLSEITMEIVTAALLSIRFGAILESDTVEGALMQAVRFCIDRNLARPDLTPDVIARAVGVSRAKLYRVCRPHGSPMELVQEQRLQRAKQLVTDRPDLRITDIAGMVGYENLETFSRAFRRAFGLSARDFREACRGDKPAK